MSVTTIAIERPPSGISRWFTENYSNLHRIADRLIRRERRDPLLSATGLLHELFLKLASSDVREDGICLGFSRRVMQQILIDHARRRQTTKRGGKKIRVRLSESTLVARVQDSGVWDLEDALEDLSEKDGRQARGVELRFYAGQSFEEVGRELGISSRAAERDWKRARNWLARRLRPARR